MSDTDALRVFAHFQRLEPPFSATEARRALGSPRWMRNVSINQILDIAGYVPLEVRVGAPLFYVELTRSKAHHSGYIIYARTTKNVPDTKALIRFFHGHAPAGARVLEYSLCYSFRYDQASSWTADTIQRHNSEIPSK